MLAIIRCRIFCFPVRYQKHDVRSVWKRLCLCSLWVWNFVAYIEGGTEAKGFENKVLRRIFGPKRDEVTGEWRKLHNEEFNDI